MAKAKLQTITSAKAVLAYVYVNKPDNFKGVDKYKVTFTLDAGPAKPLMSAMDATAANRFELAKEETADKIAKLKAKGEHAKAKKIGEPVLKDSYEVLLDENEEPTGKVRFRAVVNAEGKNDKGETWSNKPVLFDRFGKPCNVAVYGGSVAKVAVQLVPYAMDQDGVLNVGVSLRPKALQIIELATGGQKSAEGYGFGEEEGSFDGSSFTAEDMADDEEDADTSAPKSGLEDAEDDDF